jgi:cyclophilin family peptidyl-prolyl cis-trans isomerase
LARTRRLPLAIAAALAVAASVGTASAGHSAVSCRNLAPPPPRPAAHLKPPKTKLDPTKRWIATVTTNCGSFSFLLDVKHSPHTTASFAALAGKGYFDGTIFHRIVPNFVVQGGDPTQTGAGGPGYATVDTPPSATRYVKGVVAMAKTATDPRGASGSQFFVVTAPQVQLPPDYAVLGRVTSGLAVVEAIGRLGDPVTEKPTRTVLISRLRVSAR